MAPIPLALVLREVGYGLGETSLRDLLARLGIVCRRSRGGRAMISDARTDGQPPLALFLCHRNAATSIMAEAILGHLARTRIQAASAGDHAASRVNAYALECLHAHGIGTKGLRSKAWGEFFGVEKPPIRFLITLCEVYPAKSNWQGNPVVADWPTPDPTLVEGNENDIRLAFEAAFSTLYTRIQMFLALPLDRLDDGALLQELARIGERS